jgi:hypothetical protein
VQLLTHALNSAKNFDDSAHFVLLYKYIKPNESILFLFLLFIREIRLSLVTVSFYR